MSAVQCDQPDIWDFLSRDNFSVSKSDIPFCAVGANHALEQENKAIKVLGDVKGLLQKRCCS